MLGHRTRQPPADGAPAEPNRRIVRGLLAGAPGTAEGFSTSFFPAGVSAGLFWTVVLFAPPVHMFAQLRGAYSLSVFSALWRTAILLAFSITVLILFVLALVAMGVSH